MIFLYYYHHPGSKANPVTPLKARKLEKGIPDRKRLKNLRHIIKIGMVARDAVEVCTKGKLSDLPDTYFAALWAGISSHKLGTASSLERSNSMDTSVVV